MAEKPIRLGAYQQRMLDRICKTNGGGINPTLAELKVCQSLHELGLAQGKSGSWHRVVHTSEGLALWRRLQVESAP